MFRRILVFGALVTAPAIAQENANFEFMTFNTAQAYSGEVLIAGKKCKLKGAGEETCNRFAGAVVGTVQVLNLTANFNNGRFFAITGTTFNPYYTDLKNAFVAKYGQPTATDRTPWQNQLGATFENEVAKWVFADGILELRARGRRRDETRFTFIANDNVPERFKSKDQPVNF